MNGPVARAVPSVLISGRDDLLYGLPVCPIPDLFTGYSRQLLYLSIQVHEEAVLTSNRQPPYGDLVGYAQKLGSTPNHTLQPKYSG